MATTEFQTDPNHLPTAVDSMLDKMTLNETDGKDLTLSDIAKACPDPEKLATYRDAIKTFMSSPMTSTHISALSQNSCNERNCSVRQDCTDVLIKDANKAE